MCGINGFIQYEQRYSSEEMKNIVHSMNEKIIHRGPDSEGLYADEHCAIGMRRLAVIDINNGSQPIWNTARDKMIVFNGELYNFRELKKTCGDYQFKTNTDTEVALAGFEMYGHSFFSMMEGMFALAIYDLEKREWTFARDRFGEKPFYYYKDDTVFLFASELKSLLVTGMIPQKIDRISLSQYFQLTYIPAPRTIYEGVRKLSAASYMTVDSNGNETLHRYWELELHPEERLDYDGYKKALRQALFSSVEKRMISDVPIGTFLSGGIDSTVVTGIMASISDERINTFTIGFSDKRFDESDLAQITAKRLHTDHHVLRLDWDNAFGDVDKVLTNMDEPFADPSLIATYAVSRMTKQFVTVALTGDAGDELFAGYDKYLITYYSKLYASIPRSLRKRVIEPLLKLLPTDSALARKTGKVIMNAEKDIFSQRKSLMSLGFGEDACPLLMPAVPVDEMTEIWDCYNTIPGIDEQKRVQYVDMNFVLEGCMLCKVDRASMLTSLETRVPMLDNRVVELTFNMPTEYKISGRHRKIILKDAFSDLIPNELLHAPKRGFMIPLDLWLKQELRSELTEFSREDFLRAQGLFDERYVNALLQEHFSGRVNRERQLWTFFVFQYWYKNVFMKGTYTA